MDFQDTVLFIYLMNTSRKTKVTHLTSQCLSYNFGHLYNFSYSHRVTIYKRDLTTTGEMFNHEPSHTTLFYSNAHNKSRRIKCDGFYLTFNINEFLYGHIKGDIIENDSIIRTNCSGGSLGLIIIFNYIITH